MPCSLKQAAKHLKKPGLVSLGGGLPSSQLFPFAELAIKVPAPPCFSEEETLERGQTVSVGKYDVRDRDAAYDLSIALNYGQSTGSAQMMRFLTEHVEMVCNSPYADWRICRTIGNTGALEQALRMFCDRDRRDSVLTEEFSFSTALETIAPLGIKAFGCAMDDQGLLPDAMDRLLTRWDEAARGARKPRLLYTVPSGQNPTGATQGAQRRRRIYRVAQKHDVFILEGEPYYFLQMQPYAGRGQPDVPAPRSVDDFLASLIPSLVSIDVDGRVMRLDSFCKVLVPGSRMGWVVASEQIIERYQRHAEVASQGPAGFSQVILHKLLDDTWGHEGYLGWLMNLRLEYTKKRNALLAACEDHLPRDIVHWVPPRRRHVCESSPAFPSLSLRGFPRASPRASSSNDGEVARPRWMRAQTLPADLVSPPLPLRRRRRCGSGWTTRSTPARATAPSRRLMRRSSPRASTAASSSPGARGS